MQPETQKRIAQASACVIAAALLYRYVRKRLSKFTVENAVAVRASDGDTYRVHPLHGDARAAADRLALMNDRLIALMRVLRRKYARTANGYLHRTKATLHLLSRYNPDNIAENSPLDPSGDTSYVVDKGRLMALCLRERDPALKKCLAGGCPNVDPASMAFLDLNLLTFVAIHELTHIAIDAVDHPPVFWATFAWLLNEAEAANILTNARYDLHPAVYCGLTVDYTPAYDPRVTPIN
jgi:hypothetical protein